MNTVFHPSGSRGKANHGWLETYHTFSFANYFNRERMNFGVLRVLNDDTIEAGQGFGEHPHDNMEILTIPLEGDVAHQDSMGNIEVIKSGEIQVMSAGSGITHSEFNANKASPLKLLQIWVYPKKRNVEPRYQTIDLKLIEKKNQLFQILSPNPMDEGVWVYQDAWFHMGYFEAATSFSYEPRKPGNGVYIFLIEGQIEVGQQKLNPRDGYGLWDTNLVTAKAKRQSRVLIMDVPMAILRF